MSGHSKWSTIKRQKGVADAKRGQAFTKISNAITIAVRQGAGVTDPNSNFKLRLAIEKARQANMPKDNIDRAIKRAVEKGEGIVEEIMYEGFGPGGVAFLIETVTDNRQRTFSEVRNIISKNGGNLGEPGSVSYLFTKIGEIIIQKNETAFDDIFSLGLDLGVEDIEDDEQVCFLYVSPSSLFELKNKLEERGFIVEGAEIIFKAKTSIDLSEVDQEKIFQIVEKLEELDDVQKVYQNLA